MSTKPKKPEAWKHLTPRRGLIARAVLKEVRLMVDTEGRTWPEMRYVLTPTARTAAELMK